jgi:hypothetical protein
MLQHGSRRVILIYAISYVDHVHSCRLTKPSRCCNEKRKPQENNSTFIEIGATYNYKAIYNVVLLRLSKNNSQPCYRHL